MERSPQACHDLVVSRNCHALNREVLQAITNHSMDHWVEPALAQTIFWCHGRHQDWTVLLAHCACVLGASSVLDELSAASTPAGGQAENYSMHACMHACLRLHCMMHSVTSN